MRQVKNSVAFVIYSDDRSKCISVRRPDDDKDLPGVWGLPAGSLKEGESFEECVIRSGKEKLGVTVKITKFLGKGSIKRKDFDLHMKEFEVGDYQRNPDCPPRWWRRHTVYRCKVGEARRL